MIIASFSFNLKFYNLIYFLFHYNRKQDIENNDKRI